MNRHQDIPRRLVRRPRRGAALYAAVICTTMIVALIGITGLTVVRLERQQSDCVNDRLLARSNARSAIELALSRASQDPNWRTTYSSGVETAQVALGPSTAGTASFIITDTDGSLTDDDTELKLQGVGRVGDATQVSGVKITSGSATIGPVTFKENTTETSFEYVNKNKWWAQYIKPDLPDDAIEWQVTSVEIEGGKSASPNETLLVKLYVPNAFNFPDTLIEELQVPESTLPAAAEWLVFEFATSGGLDPNTGVCVALECTTTNAAAFHHYRTSGDTDPDSELIRGSLADGYTTIIPGGALLFRVHGTYKTSSGGLQVVAGTWTHDPSP